MAQPLLLLLPILSTLLLSEAATVAPGPVAGAANLTDILVKGGQYTTFLRLLNETQVLGQIQNQLNNSFAGLTVFAPTDNAFNNLKPGTLNSLTNQQQVALVLYHVLPKYYSLADFQTASNPVPTQASGQDGVYTVNVTGTASGQQVNVSTGVGTTRVGNVMHAESPLAVYSIDDVLLPYDIFGAKPPAAAAAAEPTPSAEKPKMGSAEGPATKDGGSSGGFQGRGLVWGYAVGVLLIGLLW